MSVRRSVYSLLIGTVVVVLLAVPSRSQEAPSAAPFDISFFSQTALRGQTDTQGRLLYLGNSSASQLWECRIGCIDYDYRLGYYSYAIGQARGGLKCYKS